MACDSCLVFDVVMLLARIELSTYLQLRDAFPSVIGSTKPIALTNPTNAPRHCCQFVRLPDQNVHKEKRFNHEN